MQKDFHFYCVAYLARAAGFSSRDALIIGFASQYVDDATESEPITLVDVDREIQYKFDPVRTQYMGLRANNWRIQKTIYIPFHFLPPLPLEYTEVPSYLRTVSGRNFDYITLPGSPFARWLLHEAAGEINPRRRLCRIGIALHTYADTWSHQHFSGRESRDENLVEDPDYYDRGWKRARILDGLGERLVAGVARKTGHAEAALLPDIPFLRWQYKNAKRKNVPRLNHEIFLEAAESIYRELCQINGTNPDWDQIKGRVSDCLMNRGDVWDHISEPELYFRAGRSLEERCDGWHEEFRGAFEPRSRYRYDHTEWRRIALAPNVEPDSFWDEPFSGSSDFWREDWSAWYQEKHGDRAVEDWSWDDWSNGYNWDSDLGFDARDIEWDDFSHDEARFGRLEFPLKPNFPDSLWVHFHRAALRQRHLVLEHLP
jgi:hypothetical protein